MMRPRIFFTLFIIILLGSNIAVAGALTYSWSGSLHVGDKVVVNGILFIVDRDKASNETAIIVEKDGDTLGVFYVNGSASFNVSGLQVQALLWKGQVLLTVRSDNFLQVGRPQSSVWDKIIQELKAQVKKLQEELQNKTREVQALKDQVATLKEKNQELQKKLQEKEKAQPQAQASQELIKLKEENRKLKETIANQTQKIMELKATIKNLEEQNQYLANITKDAYLYAHKVGLEESYQKEKERARIINFLWGFGKVVLSLLSVLFIGMGYLYYNWRRV